MGQLLNLRRLVPVDAARCVGDCGSGRRKCNCGAGRLSIDNDAPELGRQLMPRSLADAFADVRAPAIERPRPSLLSRVWAHLWSKS